jgi:hypothetical protein
LSNRGTPRSDGVQAVAQLVEHFLPAALEAKKDVYVKVEPVYSGNSERPDEFKVSYTIREVDDAGNVKPVTTRKTIPNA